MDNVSGPDYALPDADFGAVLGTWTAFRLFTGARAKLGGAEPK